MTSIYASFVAASGGERLQHLRSSPAALSNDLEAAKLAILAANAVRNPGRALIPKSRAIGCQNVLKGTCHRSQKRAILTW